MMLLALLLQAATPATPAAPAPPAAPRPSMADTIKPIDAALAIDTFKTTCWAALRFPEALRAAVIQAPIALTPVPRDQGGPEAGDLYRSDEALLTYVASDALPANIPSRQCTLHVRLAGTVDQLSLAGRIATALDLPSGRTSTSTAVSRTSWDMAAPDGRTTRLLAITRNAATGGGTELRLSALLLAARQN